MAEPTTNYIEIDGEGKYIEDTEAREGVSQNAADITAINKKIPASASESNKMATYNDIPDVTPLQQSINTINAKIPVSASASNQMATAADLTWKKLGDFAFATPAALPSNYNDLLIIVELNTNDNAYCFSLSKAALLNMNSLALRGGSRQGNVMIQFDAAKTLIWCSECSWDGITYFNKMSVWYR